MSGSAVSPGLCTGCAWCRIVESDRGSRFYRCGRSDSDPRFPRFPRLPVLSCYGFEPVADATRATFPEERVMATPGISIRSATPEDVPLILWFVRQLAEYEQLLEYVVATEDSLQKTLFGTMPAAEVLLAFEGETPLGFALFFHNYSTFLAQRGIYLEDLFVVPSARGRGVGRLLLAALARLAMERDCGRLEWAVLDWNAPAIGFYERLGAEPMEQWRIFRLSGDALAAVAAQG
jgi:GNAT superfamily N-acetyltransferase